MTSFFPSTSSTISELRVFVSSTFLDMMPEREHLVKKVFPEIRQLCRERGLLFTEIDLRWGITEEQGRRGGIVAACLDEIALRKPYIIALVGERYGWQPELKDLRAHHLHRHPWLEEAIAQRRSLVELESLGVGREHPEMGDRVRFYFKNKSRERKKEAAVEVEEFRQRVREFDQPLREGYGTPERLGRWVREDILALIDSIAPENHEDSWLERERRGQEAFAISRRHAYVENSATLEVLDRHAQKHRENNSGPLVVVGESGAGKSALLAWWSNRFCRHHPNAFLIEHHVGATPLSGDKIGLMRRVAWEIRERYGINEEPSADPETLIREFPSWLARTQNEPLIVVLDALNQLEERADGTPSLSWLPEHFPSTVRILLSTTDGSVADLLRARGWSTLQINPLGREERQRVVREFLGHYGKEIEKGQIRRIVQDRKTANPLYLRASLEELRLSGEHDKLEERINYYLEATDLSDLFQRILGRLEEDFGAEFTESVMRLLWASRNGLSEDELLGLLACSRLRLARLLHALEYHLMRRDGLLSFYHDHLRQGVEQRYLGLVRSRRAAHRKIGQWFREQQISPRRIEEEPWGWMGSAKAKELSDCLTIPELLAGIIGSEGDIAFFRYRKFLPERTWPELLQGILSESLRHTRMKRIDPAQRINVATRIGLLMREAAALNEAEQLIREAHRLALGHYGQTHRTVASILSQLGTILQGKGEYREAEKAMREGLETLEALNDPDMLEYADALDNLASLLYALRDYKPAEPLFKKALKIRQKKLGEGHAEVIVSLGHLGAILYGMGKLEKARNYFEQSLKLSEKTLGPLHHETATTLNNLAATYQSEERYEIAIPLLERAWSINKSLYWEDHADVIDILSNIAHFYSQAGDHKKAERTYRRVLASYRRIYPSHHSSTARCHINLGTILWKQNELDKAETEYRSALEMLQSLHGNDHVATHSCWLDIGGILLDKGEIAGALEIYGRSLPIKEAVLGRDHPDVEQSYQRIEKAGLYPPPLL